MKSVIRIIGFLLFVYVVILLLVSQLKIQQALIPDCVDGFELVIGSSDHFHQRQWEFNDFSRSFCSSYYSQEQVSQDCAGRREKLDLDEQDYEEFWGEVYLQLARDSRGYIDFIVDSLGLIAEQEQLSRSEIAELVVTFVQDIPYSFIIGSDCESFETDGKPCLGNVALGILSPYEFVHSLYGDCDTRSVFLYAVLKEMEFDPMIVISYEYAHAMLALNVPASGDYLIYNRNKYYFWETTGKGWPIGLLPPSTGNIGYWKIALVDEF